MIENWRREDDEIRPHRGHKQLPGATEAADRFVRGAYYFKHLTKPANDRETVAGVLSVMRNISAPFGESDPGRSTISRTRWRTVADRTNCAESHRVAATVGKQRESGLFEPSTSVRRWFGKPGQVSLLAVDFNGELAEHHQDGLQLVVDVLHE